MTKTKFKLYLPTIIYALIYLAFLTWVQLDPSGTFTTYGKEIGFTNTVIKRFFLSLLMFAVAISSSIYYVFKRPDTKLARFLLRIYYLIFALSSFSVFFYCRDLRQSCVYQVIPMLLAIYFIPFVLIASFFIREKHKWELIGFLWAQAILVFLLMYLPPA